jgi:hypothetical protein
VDHTAHCGLAGVSVEVLSANSVEVAVKGLKSRLARLEALCRKVRHARLEIRLLKPLPEDFVGERHIVAVQRTPTSTMPYGLWEERPGPGLTGGHDEGCIVYLEEADLAF